MTVNAQSGCGKVRLFNDLISGDVIANTGTVRQLGDFRIFGDGIAEADAAVATIGSDELSGVGRLTTTNEDKHATCIGTPLILDVALMAPIVVEARVRFAALTAKHAFIGIADTVGDDLSLEDDMMLGATTTLTLTASDLCGFYYSSDLTDSADWHMAYNGGTTTGETTSTSVDANDDAVAGEWQILRLEIDPNGDARWYIDEDLKQTVEDAVSTTVDVGVVCGVEANSTTIATMDVDYLLVEANRDWNA